MNSRKWFIVYILIIHLVIGVICYLYFKEKWIFLTIQIPLLLSFLGGIYFYYLSDKPFRVMLDHIKNLEKQDVNSTIAKTGNQHIDSFISTYNKMISNLREERYRLEGQGKFLEDLIAISPVGVVITDYDNKVLEINKSALLALNKNQNVVKDIDLELILPEKHFKNEKTNIFSIGQKRLRLISDRVRYKGFYRNVVLIEDLTDELLATEKEAYGKIIRMMAHEVNNSVGAVSSILQSIYDFLDGQNSGKEWLDITNIAIERNKNLTTFVEIYASVLRIYNPQKQDVNIKNLIEKTISIRKCIDSGKNIQYKVEEQPGDSDTIRVDPVQIEQVFLNILKNAEEAIENEGQIVVSINQNGSFIRITNDGNPLDKDNSEQIFQRPFYSTKPQGQGIGLMLIREILLLHHATFELYSDEYGLTHFDITFDKR
jgi:two-component system, NtrC family, nitrogen regulation sensor histidine kinase NtrY